MDLFITQVPLWLSITFIICFMTAPVFLIANAVKKANHNINRIQGAILNKKIILFYWTYFGIIAVVSLTGFFSENTLPPRIIVTTAIPLFLFYFFYIQKTDWFKITFSQIKLEQLITIHLFRFVGVFFILVELYGVLPKQFALIGGIGDIVSALLVIPVVIALRQKRTFAKSLAWVWNIIGLIDIFSVLTTAIIVTLLAIITNESGVQQFGTFPFSWIPAFAPATIIFLHILTFKKLLEPDKD